MKFLETPEQLLESNSRSNYEQDVTDVVESVIHIHRYSNIIQSFLEEDEIQDSRTPISFFYKEGFSSPVAMGIPTCETDNIKTKDIVMKTLVSENFDYCIHVRICYGIFFNSEQKNKENFTTWFSEYNASIELIEDCNISDPDIIDELLCNFRNISATCIDRVGNKYQILLSQNKTKEFEEFIKDKTSSKQIDLNDMFTQEFMAFTLNKDREFKHMNKSEFLCIPSNEFAISVVSF